MKNRYLLILFSLLFLILIGCKDSYTITFESNGGSSVGPFVISSGNTIDNVEPTRQGYNFLGWFMDEKLTQPYDFTSKIKSNFTLYAKWDLVVNLIENINLKSNSISFIIDDSKAIVNYMIFEINLYNENVLIEKKSSGFTSTITFNNLTKNTNYRIEIIASYEENGFVKNKVVIQEYNFKTSDTMTVITNLNGGTILNNITEYQFGPSDDLSIIPNPVKEGFKFIGWYNDQGEEITSVDQLSNNIIIEARWELKNVILKLRVPSGSNANALTNIIAAFNSEYPNITIQLDSVSGNFNDVMNLTLLDINSNQAPDMVIGYPEHFATYYEGGVLTNLQSFIDDEIYGYTNNEINDFIYDFLLESKGFDNKKPDDIYTLPFLKSTEVLVYNQTIFQGLYGDNWMDKIPKTWGEVETVGKEIVQKVKNGEADYLIKNQYGSYLNISKHFAYETNFYPMIIDSATNGFHTLTLQSGSGFVGRNVDGNTKILFNNQNTMDGLNLYKNLYQQGVMSTSDLYETFASEMLKDGKCVMAVTSSAGLIYYKSQNYQYELGVAPIPYQSDDQKHVLQMGSSIGILNQNTEAEKLASWLFIKFLSEPKYNAMLAIDSGFRNLPSRLSAYDTDQYKTYKQNPNSNNDLFIQAHSIFVNIYIPTYNIIPHLPEIGFEIIRQRSKSMFLEIVYHDINPNQRMQELLDLLKLYNNP